MSSSPAEFSETVAPPEQPAVAPKQSAGVKSAVRDIVETLILTVIIFLAVQSVVKNFRVEGHSMDPSLHDGQFLLVNKALYWSIDSRLIARINPSAARAPAGARTFLFRAPQRGDIIVFQFPQDLSRDFVKRVIGVPGDVVAVQDGYVYVNNKPLDERYIEAPPRYSMSARRVPLGSYFVLGDNRNNSSDSHVWGVVPMQDIIGQAWISYWPSQDWGVIPAATPVAAGP